MPILETSELKRALLAAGFEVYRTLGDYIVLADRVRDNLLMDSGVAVATSPRLRVRFVVRAQRNEFPGETPEQLFGRARILARPGTERGYVEVSATTSPVFDPGDKSRTLDVWYEVGFERQVIDLLELLSELRFALAIEKTSQRP